MQTAAEFFTLEILGATTPPILNKLRNKISEFHYTPVTRSFSLDKIEYVSLIESIDRKIDRAFVTPGYKAASKPTTALKPKRPSTSRVKKFREDQKEIGRKCRDFYLTDSEMVLVKKFVSKMRDKK